ncbi:O-antigen ligase family protein [Geobacillus thermoleovorans]|uniref:O-antigen ligase family protein n=1 Tax=Geobacillus thermoleovorans TaxID=33941 RepID=UPI003DA1EFF1
MRNNISVKVIVLLFFISLFRLSTEDPKSSSIGIQEIFELVLQTLGVLLLIIGVFRGKVKLSISGSTILWILFGVLTIFSAFWSPSVVLSVLKGIQLIVFVTVLTILSSQFANQRDISRFISYTGTVILLLILLIQYFVGGLDSIWKVYEAGNLIYGENGRQRLSVLSTHPGEIGALVGAFSLMLVVNNPKGIDWFIISILFIINILTDARTALLILLFLLIVYIFLQFLIMPKHPYIKISIVFFIFSPLLCLGFIFYVNNFLIDLVPEDIGTLNGRIPLWSAILQEMWFGANAHLSLLFGHGFSSFRFFGLNLFDYAGEAHNAALQVFFELGIVGFALWSSAILSSLVRVWNKDHSILENIISLLPLIYLLMLQMMGSALADSRSFYLFLLLLYTHTNSVNKRRSNYSASN